MRGVVTPTLGGDHMSDEPMSEGTEITGLRRKRGRIVLLIGLGIAAVVILTWAIVRSGAQKPTSNSQSAGSPTPTVIVTSVVSQDLNRELRLPGELQA
jgi:multidrug efflux pump subunit AcrA (membrane-fusion protein)